jgi:hypothetical protein
MRNKTTLMSIALALGLSGRTATADDSSFQLSVQRARAYGLVDNSASGWQATLASPNAQVQWIVDAGFFDGRYDGALTVMTGPRAYVPTKRLRPFVQLLAGPLFSVGSDGDGGTLVLSPGAGLDLDVSGRVRLRAEGAILLAAGGAGGRLSAGLVFVIGGSRPSAPTSSRAR